MCVCVCMCRMKRRAYITIHTHTHTHRMKDVGIVPVLPGFSGFVPPVFVDVFPEAAVSQLGDWNGFGKDYDVREGGGGDFLSQTYTQTHRRRRTSLRGNHNNNQNINSNDHDNSKNASMSNVLFLEPTDPLFPELGRRFICLQQAAYGDLLIHTHKHTPTPSGHFYGVDSFNEQDPRTNDSSYLHAASASVMEGM